MTLTSTRSLSVYFSKMDNRLVCLMHFVTFLQGINSWYDCEFDLMGDTQTMTCIFGCCGDTFNNTCCNRTTRTTTPSAIDQSEALRTIQIVFGVGGGVICLGMVIGVLNSCFRFRRYSRDPMRMRNRYVGRPYTVYSQNNTRSLTSLHPYDTSTVMTAGPNMAGQTFHPTTTYGQMSNSMGTAYPSMGMQQGVWQTRSSFSVEPSEQVEPSSPQPPIDPPPYSDTAQREWRSS